jgi:uncharacterized protein YjbI with pentapeptide repeats
MSDLLELLQRGDVEAFNTRRSARSRPDLFAAELPGAKLMGADLSQADLEKADLTGADLTDATLVRANLSGSDGTGVSLDGVLGLKVRLRGAWWDQAKLDGADLTRGDLTEAVFTGATGEGVRLVGAKLRHADCKGVKWPGAELTEARLHHCDLTGADLSRADLSEAVATEATLVDADLRGIVAANANLAESDLTRADLSGARLTGASLARTNLTEADLSGADLTRADLSGATLTGVRLSGACLADANLEGVSLAGLDLQGVDLTGHDPRTLGLDDAAISQLAAWGAPVVEGAPLVVHEPAAARSGDLTAFLWLNPDTETLETLRWGLVGGGEARHGTLPLSAEGVLARMVVPVEDGFELVMVQDRPGGAALTRLHLSPEGALGPPRSVPLGYPPAVVPVAEVRDGVLWLMGLARRGPTLVVQRESDDPEQPGLELVHSEKTATATGFWSTHHAVVATRGGVVIGVDKRGTGAPKRAPEGFPGKAARVVDTGEALVAVWFEPGPDSETPGRLRWAELGGRGAPTVRTLKEVHAVTSLDAVAGAGEVHVAWVERHGLLASLVFRATLPGGELSFLQAAGDGAHEVRFAPGRPSERPALVVATLDEKTVAIDGTEVMGVLGEAPADPDEA